MLSVRCDERGLVAFAAVGFRGDRGVGFDITRSSGTIDAASRMGAEFLKVMIPRTKMQNPSARNSRRGIGVAGEGPMGSRRHAGGKPGLPRDLDQASLGVRGSESHWQVEFCASARSRAVRLVRLRLASAVVEIEGALADRDDFFRGRERRAHCANSTWRAILGVMRMNADCGERYFVDARRFRRLSDRFRSARSHRPR